MMFYELGNGDFFRYEKDKEPTTIYMIFKKNQDIDDYSAIIIYHPDENQIGRIVGFWNATEIVPLNVTLKFEPKEV